MARGTFLEKRLNVFVLLFVGTVDLIRDYFRHDTGDAIVVILIFSWVAPYLFTCCHADLRPSNVVPTRRGVSKRQIRGD